MGRADRIPIISEKKVIFEGIYDMQETYDALRGFLETRQYDPNEKDYGEKNLGNSREIDTKLEFEMYYTDYYKSVITYSLLMKGKNVEINSNGKKHKLTEGKATLIINGFVEADYMDKRKESPLMGFVSKVYDKYFGKEEFSKVIGTMAGDVEQLVSIFKQQMNTNLK